MHAEVSARNLYLSMIVIQATTHSFVSASPLPPLHTDEAQASILFIHNEQRAILGIASSIILSVVDFKCLLLITRQLRVSDCKEISWE